MRSRRGTKPSRFVRPACPSRHREKAKLPGDGCGPTAGLLGMLWEAPIRFNKERFGQCCSAVLVLAVRELSCPSCPLKMPLQAGLRQSRQWAGSLVLPVLLSADLTVTALWAGFGVSGHSVAACARQLPSSQQRSRGSSKSVSYGLKKRSCLDLRSRMFLTPGMHFRRGGTELQGAPGKHKPTSVSHLLSVCLHSGPSQSCVSDHPEFREL